MLGASSFMGFIPVRDLDDAREFYTARLGLSVSEQTPAMLMLDAVSQFSAQPFTIAGWRVLDIAETVDRLADQGIEMLRYPEFEQDDHGVWRAPNGNRVAWFQDPDHNVLSLTQFEGAVVDEFWV
jgi:catechol 2,3-dioxygenase-like lactoylglutathione lyase family enzyme